MIEKQIENKLKTAVKKNGGIALSWSVPLSQECPTALSYSLTAISVSQS